MANDTMEKLADDLSAVTIPSCKHLEREEYRDCVMQMLDDLEQLGRRDGCIAAAWALDALPSFQRELAEARKIIADAASALTNDGLAGVLAAQLMLLRAPAPSDVKGEEPSASDTNCGGKHIESDTKLTPLTDPSVRGVLVDDGEPTKELKCFRAHVLGSKVFTPEYHFKAENPWQPVKLRPASEFGVAGAERIKELEAERSSFGSVLRQEREAAHAATAEAERLRKAIEEHKRHMINMPHRPARHNQELWSALSPSPAAASGERESRPLSPAVETMLGIKPTVCTATKTASAPAAESKGGEDAK